MNLIFKQFKEVLEQETAINLALDLMKLVVQISYSTTPLPERIYLFIYKISSMTESTLESM